MKDSGNSVYIPSEKDVLAPLVQDRTLPVNAKELFFFFSKNNNTATTKKEKSERKSYNEVVHILVVRKVAVSRKRRVSKVLVY